MKILIIHKSKTGRTRQYAIEISKYLKEIGNETNVIPLSGYKERMLDEYDILLLGCWTHGLFFIMQHPDKEWIDFVKKLPDLSGKRIGLFTTYKILVGSMFKNMIKYTPTKNSINLFLKSKNMRLTESDKIKLNEFVTI
jgi:flavodoxin